MKIDKSGNTIYHCETYEDSVAFLTKCQREGIVWFSLREALDGKGDWYEYGADTCYGFEYNKLVYGESTDFEDNVKIVKYKRRNKQ